MIVPEKLQIFSHNVRLTDHDYERLKHLISYWSKRTADVLMQTNEPDLERMLVIELMTHKRKHMVNRLVSRLVGTRRHELRAKVEGLL